MEIYFGYGLTAWGILMFLLTSISDSFLDGKAIQIDLALLSSFVIKASVGGFLFGWLSRKICLLDYKKLKTKAD